VTAGRLLAAVLVLAGVLAGGTMYYLQVWGYYDRLPPAASFALAGLDAPVALIAYEGIDSASSPLRRRECLTLAAIPEGLLPADRPQPLNPPPWFTCFDAPAISADLAAGRARAVLVEGNFRFGFDRVMALYPDGRGYVWPQINTCGSAHFDGRPLPAGCPTPPER
jgi:hypothetical protein